jgi:hypothetical protein
MWQLDVPQTRTSRCVNADAGLTSALPSACSLLTSSLGTPAMAPAQPACASMRPAPTGVCSGRPRSCRGKSCVKTRGGGRAKLRNSLRRTSMYRHCCTVASLRPERPKFYIGECCKRLEGVIETFANSPCNLYCVRHPTESGLSVHKHCANVPKGPVPRERRVSVEPEAVIEGLEIDF